MSVICRIGFCPVCQRAGRPNYSEAFLAFGAKRNDYVVYRARKSCHYLDRGFTPHLYKRGIVENGIMAYTYACSMMDCDCERRKLDNGMFLYFIPDEKWKLGCMPLKEWNKMVTWKDTGYRL